MRFVKYFSSVYLFKKMDIVTRNGHINLVHEAVFKAYAKFHVSRSKVNLLNNYLS